ncbi:hypothetical protein HY625_01170 [Candidatus Uhrbacteria bacterium]|nr:hypothetical protein [Candidatus Uhrbacteria bacterium]
MSDAEKNGIDRAEDMNLGVTQEAKPDKRTARLRSLRFDIARYNDSTRSTNGENEEQNLNFQALNLPAETRNALDAKMRDEASLKEGQKREHEAKWKELLLLEESLSFDEVKRFMQLPRSNRFPSSEELLVYVRNKPKETIQNTEAHRAEIEGQGGSVEAMVKNCERFEGFKDFEIKRVEDLRHWDKIKSFLESSNLKTEGISVIVIVIDNEEYWKNFYGSNPSKSVPEPKTIILKKEIFEQEDISEENLSWIVHEIGHLSFYDFLDDKTGEYMAGVEKEQKYTETAMESIAFQVQVDYLKSLGKTKEQCSAFMKSYIDESFGSDQNLDDAQRKLKQKELEQLMRYVQGVFAS